MANDEKKIVCPDCETDNAADATECKKCGLPFVLGETIKLADFLRIMDVRDKRKKKETPEKKEGFRLFR